MALIYIDDCSVGLGGQGKELVIQLKDIKGFPEGLAIIIPFGPASTEELYQHLDEMYHPGKKIHLPNDRQVQEVQHGGTPGQAA